MHKTNSLLLRLLHIGLLHSHRLGMDTYRAFGHMYFLSLTMTSVTSISFLLGSPPMESSEIYSLEEKQFGGRVFPACTRPNDGSNAVLGLVRDLAPTK